VGRALFEQSPFSTVLYDTDGRIIAVNAAFTRLFGLTKDAIPAEYSVLTDPQLAQGGHLPAVRRAFEGEVAVLPVVFYDAATIDGGGRRSWTQGHFFPMRDAAGAVRGVVLVHVDLTERVEAEQQLAEQAAELELQAEELQAINEEVHRANEQLDAARDVAERAREQAEAANRAKSDFLATMSHELRTPLNAIGGYAQLIEMGVHGPVTDAQGDALKRVQRSQQHLLSLINDVLNFAKLEAGRVTYDVARVRVRDLLAGLETLVAPQLAAKSLRFDCCECDPTLAVMADADKVQQVLLNLLSNAIKFTPDGGEISVGVGAHGDAVLVTVTDTGIGIPAERLEAVFEPFVQLARGGDSGRDGTGLGLAISRDLARAMAGDLVAESTVGEGSTFILSLPRAVPGA
jgi:PAS domain S-box-containing protein